jgi:predicted TIM-barrel fold metal-dependent hydrolase
MSHPGDFEIYMLEIMGDNGRRALHELIFGGVFERHPKLKLVYTEVLDRWWTEALAQMDDMAEFFWHRDGQRRPSQRVHAGPHGLAKLPHLPSYYCRRSLFIGWTTLAPFEAQDAVDHEYDSQVLWGSDYPHPEGSYQYPRADDEVPITRLHLRDTFAGIPRERAAAMIGGNAIRVYGFDQAKLQGVADRINSMTFTELGTPLDEEPEDFVTRSAAFCFRRSGAYN